MNQNDVLPHRPLPGLLVDGFRHAASDVRLYVLTHFHSDHYGGLDDSFPTGIGAPEGAVIYCTPVTAGLVEHVLGVSRKFLVVTPFDTTVVLTLPGGSTVELTFIPANHCPGSAMLLLRSAAQAILHTGDCRFCPAMLQSPALQPWVQRGHGASGSSASASASASLSSSASAAAAAGPALPLDMFLDTTYAHPKHVFLPQEESLRLGVSIVAQFMPRMDPSQLLLDDGAGSSSAGGGASGAGAGAASSNAAAMGDISDCDGSAVGSGAAARDSSASAARGYDAAAAAMMFPSAPPPPAPPLSARRTDATTTPGRRHGDDACASGSAALATSSLAAAGASSPLSPSLAPPSAPRIALLAPLEPPFPPARTDRTLVIVSTYVIGKERLLLELARRLHLRIFVSDRKLELVRLLGLSQSDAGWFTCSKRDADVHVAGMDACGKHFPYFAPDFARMRRYCAAVNRLHALAELGLLPAAASAARGAFGGSGRGCSSVAAASSSAAGAGGASAALVSPVFDAAAGIEDDDDDETGAASRRSKHAAAAAAHNSSSAAGTGSSAAGGAGGVSSAAAAPHAPSGAAASGTTGYAYGRFMPQPPDIEARIAALHLRYTRVIGLLPTGWVHSNKKKAYVSPGAGASGAAGAGNATADSVATTSDGAAVGIAEEADGRAVGGAGAGAGTPASAPSQSPSAAAAAPAAIGGEGSAVGAELAAEVHLIPYSEHSSFEELTAFVKALRPRKLVPTVYGDAADRDRIVARFSSLLDTTAAKRDFLKAFGAGSAAASTGKAGSSNGLSVVKGATGEGRSRPEAVPPKPVCTPGSPAASTAGAQQLVSRSDSCPVGSSSTRGSCDISSSSAKRARVDTDIIELDDDGDIVQSTSLVSSAAKSVIGTSSVSGKTAKTRAAPAAAIGDIMRFFSRA